MQGQQGKNGRRNFLFTYLLVLTHMHSNGLGTQVFCQFSSLNREISELKGKGHEPSRAENSSARLGLITIEQLLQHLLDKSGFCDNYMEFSTYFNSKKEQLSQQLFKEIRYLTFPQKSAFFMQSIFNRQFLKVNFTT